MGKVCTHLYVHAYTSLYTHKITLFKSEFTLYYRSNRELNNQFGSIKYRDN